MSDYEAIAYRNLLNCQTEKYRLTADNKRLRDLNAEMLVACKEGLMVCDGNRAMNSRGMIAYAIAKACAALAEREKDE